jgi:hypothetical protein
LRQEITKSFHARMEMRLVGPRDVAKLVEGFGACGEARCCARFLTEFSPVSIKMAKEQGISLNPQEITGMCGRLRCCLIYEYEQYVMARKALPQRGKQVGTPHGQGEVVDIYPIQDSVLVKVGEQQVTVHRDQIQPLEQWEALQKRAAEPCKGGEDCTCGLHKPAAQATKKAEEPPAQPGASPASERSERAAHRRHHRDRRSDRPPDRRSSKSSGDSASSRGHRPQ